MLIQNMRKMKKDDENCSIPPHSPVAGVRRDGSYVALGALTTVAPVGPEDGPNVGVVERGLEGGLALGTLPFLKKAGHRDVSCSVRGLAPPQIRNDGGRVDDEFEVGGICKKKGHYWGGKRGKTVGVWSWWVD